MIRCIAAVALLACTTQVFAAPKAGAKPTAESPWTLVTQDLRASKYYVDPASIKHEAGMTTVWLMTDSTEAEKTRGGIVYLSKVEKRHLKCDSSEQATVHRQLHQGNMMAGKVLSEATAPVDFVPVMAGTAEESMLQHVCSNRGMIAASH